MCVNNTAPFKNVYSLIKFDFIHVNERTAGYKQEVKVDGDGVQTISHHHPIFITLKSKLTEILMMMIVSVSQ
jgi:hypothetical protein